MLSEHPPVVNAVEPYELHHGDVLDVLPTLEAESFDAMLTDPPYGLEFMGRDWDRVVPGPDVWRETLRVLKPGAFALVFGGTRTFHRLAVALEDAGFELRDTLMWVYGSGFPKSHDVSKAIDKAAGAEREEGVPGRYAARRPRAHVEAVSTYQDGVGSASSALVTAPATPAAERWQGYGTALKPAWESIILVRKPTPLTFAQNALEHGCGALNIDACRIGTSDYLGGGTMGGVFGNGKPASKPEAGSIGRWPANLIHDGSDEVVSLFPHTKSGKVAQGTLRGAKSQASVSYADMAAGSELSGYGDEGSAARFFYASKASQSERSAGLEGRNGHPTVKPLALTEYLAKLLLPPEGGKLLVPFSGSGSEMLGALRAGWESVVGIEREPEYVTVADARIAHWVRGIQPRLLEAAS